ncbi:MAG: MBL fold metallo-hydrolase [Sphingomonas sp.]|nr:MBL fold metallo-hydrolase [Sphingomonas sp.]
MKLRVLGSGTSSGVPRIGGADGAGDWGDCDPTEPRNRRTRASVLVETASTRLLVDTSPDLREQLLAAGVKDIDAVIWTHDHADHCHGMDDLRRLYRTRGRPVRGFARAETMASLTSRFSYVFNSHAGYPAIATIELLPDRLAIGDVVVEVVDQPHGEITTAGLRFTNMDKKIGYSTDFHTLTPAMAALYWGMDLWVVDALRRQPHPSHPTLSQTLDWASQLAVKQAVLIHMDQTMDYATLVRELPPGVQPGYDGMELVL